MNISFDENKKIKDFDYGENSYQRASVYEIDNMLDYEIVKGNELTYNNVIDLTAITDISSEFYDVNCVTVVKKGKPCAVALGCSIYEAYTKAFDCDPISSLGSVIGFSKKIDSETAKHLKSISPEAVIAPDYDNEALKLLNNTKLIKLKTPLKECRHLVSEELTITPFGLLVQDKNNSELDKDKFKVVTTEKPVAEQVEDAVFAWKIAKHAKSNSVVIAKDFKTSAISQGHTNVLSAVENALDYACDNTKDAILASDSVINSVDAIHSAIQGRIKLIIQPGGSDKDQQITDTCNKYGIIMILTGITNYNM